LGGWAKNPEFVIAALQHAWLEDVRRGSCFKQWAEPSGTVHALTVAEDVGIQLENVAKRKETEDGS
jgi:hypothetical protein